MKRVVLESIWFLLTAGSWVSASSWKWPDQKEPYESKPRFVEAYRPHQHDNLYSMSSSTEHFKEPVSTDGFYNRPESSGRYSVQNRPGDTAGSVHPYRADSRKYSVSPNHPHVESHDGPLESLQYCRCTLTTEDCIPSPDHLNACGNGKILCCYTKSRKELMENFFGEDDDEDKATILPGRDRPVGAFPPPPSTVNLFSPDRTHDITIIGLAEPNNHPDRSDEQQKQDPRQFQQSQGQFQQGPEQYQQGPGQFQQSPGQFQQNSRRNGIENNQIRHQPPPTRVASVGHESPHRYSNPFHRPYLSSRDLLRSEEIVDPRVETDSNEPDDPLMDLSLQRFANPLKVLGPMSNHQELHSIKLQKQKKTLIINNNKIKKPFSHSSLNNIPVYSEPEAYRALFKEPGVSETAQRTYGVDPRFMDPRSRDVLAGPAGYTGIIGPYRNPGILTGPDGPTGSIGPYRDGRSFYDRELIVGPGGPTGYISPNRGVLYGPGGPSSIHSSSRGVLAGPGGATGRIGPDRNVLTGPRGPTGRIGPDRGVLTGPGGPTGRIGPDRGVLAGPGGPTGRIGPDRGVLVGPQGPTGRIGPNRGILVGPGGPTGKIGPDRGVLTGPGRATGRIGPDRGILVGPGGPTGKIGPDRGVLTGPAGATGRIGPDRGIFFTGPGSPTGRIGPSVRPYVKRNSLAGQSKPSDINGPVVEFYQIQGVKRSDTRSAQSSNTNIEHVKRDRRRNEDLYGLIDSFIETRRTSVISPDVHGN